MRRLPAFAAFVLLSAGLWSGAASAASLESLVMPGPVAAGHAETEHTCSACHSLFDQGSQGELCLDCHEPIADDIAAGSGFHGKHPEVGATDCRGCHAEHKGRDADITGLVPDLFDHTFTDFELTGAHTAVSCGACHESEDPDARPHYADAPATCNGCHGDEDPHQGELGEACADCHSTDHWPNAQFDHDATEFPLSGQHADATCLSCHESRLFEAPASECIDCHRLDDVHAGGNGTQCGDCHGSSNWEVRFDHAAETGYELLGAHSMLTCSNCHLADQDFEAAPTDCHGCHSGDDVHLGRNGTSCDDCHGQSEWSTSFDHLAETGHALLGAHADLACAACHGGGLDMPVATDCIGCHDRDDPHDGTLDECDACHGEQDWLEELRFHHDLADFALVGLHRTVSCEQCHDSLVFSPLAGECNACHSDDDVHKGSMGEDCSACHTPVGWDYWLFDHDTTGFSLSGAHQSLACADCHDPDKPVTRQTSACSTCHRSDDVHHGGFGQQCDRCHTTDSFEELKGDL